MKKIIRYITLLFLAQACVYPYNPEIDSAVNTLLVVDGSIIIGGTSSINLSYLTPLGEDPGYQKPHGRAWIEDEEGNTYKSSSPSVLASNISIPTEEAPGGRKYRAAIEVDGLQYYSDWMEPLAPPVIKSVHFRADDRNVYVLADVEAGSEGTGYLGFAYEEDWEFHAEYIPEAEIDPHTWQYNLLIKNYPPYWCYKHFNSQGAVLVNYGSTDGTLAKDCVVQSFLRTNNRNHKRYYILVKAYNMPEEVYRYDHYLQELSEIGGTLFSPEPGQLTGNMHCESKPELQVLGMVRAAQMSSMRASIRTEYMIETYPDDNTLVLPSPEDYETLYYVSGYRPVKSVNRDEGSGIGWGHERCINCIVAGGTQEKPSFWE